MPRRSLALRQANIGASSASRIRLGQRGAPPARAQAGGRERQDHHAAGEGARSEEATAPREHRGDEQEQRRRHGVGQDARFDGPAEEQQGGEREEAARDENAAPLPLLAREGPREHEARDRDPTDAQRRQRVMRQRQREPGQHREPEVDPGAVGAEGVGGAADELVHVRSVGHPGAPWDRPPAAFALERVRTGSGQG